jgi:hypothetical protein
MSSFKKEKKYHTKWTKADTQFIGSHHHHSSLVGSHHHLYCILKEREREVMTGLFTKRKSCEKSQRPLPLPSSHCHVKPFLLALKKHVNGRMFIKDIKRQEIFLVLCFIWLCFYLHFFSSSYGDVWLWGCLA